MSYNPLNPNGQATMANSQPVVVASDQSAVPVSGTVTANIGTVATLATAAKQDTIIGHVDGIEGILTTIDGDTGGIAAGYAAEDAALGSGVLLQGDDGTDRKNINVDATTGDVQVDVTNTVTVQATNLDVRDIDAASDDITIHGDVGVIDQLDLTNSNPAAVAIVDGNGDQITSFGGGTQYTEDAAAAANPVGTAVMLVRDDALSGQTTTDGDNVAARGTDKGEQYVKAVDSDALLTTIDADTSTLAGAVSGTEMQVDVLTMPTTTVQATDLDIRPLVNTDVVTAELSAVDNAVLDTIDAVLDTIKTDTASIVTATQLIDDAIIADDAAFTPATTKVMMAGFEFDDAAVDSVNEGDGGAARMSANRNIYVQLRDAAGNERGLNIDASNRLAATVTAASGAFASGSIASGAIASGAIASGAIAAGAIAAGATSIATTEDTASAAGDHLVKIAAARLDTPVANAGVSNDGDYTSPIVDNFRKLWVSGTVPEDTAHVAGEALTVLGARRIDTAATSAGSSADWATVDASAEGALWTTSTPTTTSGCTIFRTLDLDETEEEVKATAGNLYGYFFANLATSVRYLKFYNATAATVSVGSTTPVLTFPLPASQSGHISFGFPVSFGTAMTVAATTGVADADTGAPSANDVVLNVFYK